jgi:hypothetical protein
VNSRINERLDIAELPINTTQIPIVSNKQEFRNTPFVEFLMNNGVIYDHVSQTFILNNAQRAAIFPPSRSNIRGSVQ